MKLTCILCPLSCAVEITETGEDYDVKGFQCKRGKEYAVKELTDPTRTITSTVKTSFKDFPRLPVKTDREVPMKAIFDFMKVINSVYVKKRLKPGDIVMKRILDTDINLIATDNMAQFTAMRQTL